MPEGISRKELTKAITCLYVSFCSSVCKKQQIKQNRTEKKEEKGVTKSRGEALPESKQRLQAAVPRSATEAP